MKAPKSWRPDKTRQHEEHDNISKVCFAEKSQKWKECFFLKKIVVYANLTFWKTTQAALRGTMPYFIPSATRISHNNPQCRVENDNYIMKKKYAPISWLYMTWIFLNLLYNPFGIVLKKIHRSIALFVQKLSEKKDAVSQRLFLYKSFL